MTSLVIQPPARLKSMAAIALLLWCAAAPVALAADPATLTVTFEGLKTHSGAVLLSLSAGEAAYEGKAPQAAQAVSPVTGASLTTTFTGLPPGLYGIRAFHDIDGDGKLDTNPFGMPTEPFAFSNNAQGMMGPAKWGAAAFEIKAGANSHTIALD